MVVRDTFVIFICVCGCHNGRPGTPTHTIPTDGVAFRCTCTVFVLSAHSYRTTAGREISINIHTPILVRRLCVADLLPYRILSTVYSRGKYRRSIGTPQIQRM